MKVSFWDSRIGRIIRWVGVLPIALFCMLAVRILWGLWIDITPDYFTEGSIAKLLIVDGIGSVIAGCAFMFFGYQIAPLKNKLTAIILLVMLLIFTCFGFISTLIQEGEYAIPTITFCGLIIGGVISCYHIVNQNEDSN